MVTRFLDQAGLIALWGKIKNYISNYVGNAEFQIKTKVGNTVTEVADFTANQQAVANNGVEVPDGITFIQGNNVVLTPNTTNKTITIAAVATAPNNGNLEVSTVAGGTGTLLTTMDETNYKTLTIAGGTNINTAITTAEDEVIVTVNHDTMTYSAETSSELTKDSATATTYVVGNNILSGMTFYNNNGHITKITPTYSKIAYATESTGGLMSAEDKKTLKQVNQNIANALTSAITPKGSISASDLVSAVTDSESILNSTHVGDLYQLSSPLVIGQTQSGDVSMTYGYFVDGGQITETGTTRFVLQTGTYVMIVNTGTTQNPVYKLDIVSGLYDMSNYVETSDIKVIPVDTSDDDYEEGVPTIDSICV